MGVRGSNGIKIKGGTSKANPLLSVENNYQKDFDFQDFLKEKAPAKLTFTKRNSEFWAPKTSPVENQKFYRACRNALHINKDKIIEEMNMFPNRGRHLMIASSELNLGEEKVFFEIQQINRDDGEPYCYCVALSKSLKHVQPSRYLANAILNFSKEGGVKESLIQCYDYSQDAKKLLIDFLAELEKRDGRIRF